MRARCKRLAGSATARVCGNLLVTYDKAINVTLSGNLVFFDRVTAGQGASPQVGLIAFRCLIGIVIDGDRR